MRLIYYVYMKLCLRFEIRTDQNSWKDSMTSAYPYEFESNWMHMSVKSRVKFHVLWLVEFW